MTSKRPSVLLGLLAGAGACSGGPPAPSSMIVPIQREPVPTARTVTFGPNEVATLGENGALSIVRGMATTVLRTAPGTPLFSTGSDGMGSGAYHDPEKLEGVALRAVPDGAITMSEVEPGVLHLTAKSRDKAAEFISLALATDDGFYTGLGERYDHVDPRGQIVGMQLELQLADESGTTDRHVPVPWVVSSNGYGVLVLDRSIGAWDVGSARHDIVRATFVDSALDVMIVVDPDPLVVVAKLASLTGLQRKTPLWALGPMMWRHVDDQAELMSDLGMIRSLHIPTTTFWLDDGWQTGIDTFDFDPTKYTSTASLAKSMTDMGFRWFGWNSPYLEAPAAGEAAELMTLYASANQAHEFVEDSSGATFLFPGPGSGQYGLVDFTSPKASAFWTGLASKPVGIGMDGFKLDYGEDLVPDVLGAPLGAKLSDGQTERTARNYPLLYHQAYRNALAKTSDGGILIVRASSYGGASVCDIVWPGDLDNGFQTAGSVGSSGTYNVGGLPASVIAAETLAVSGFPLYGADTGGYRGGAPTKEALLRWAEHTALSMVLQLGPGESKYPWNYDAGTVTTYTALADLHQSLVPYLYGLLQAAESAGTPTIRPLPLAYPADKDAPSFADTEYLLGPDLLVAPVVVEGATSRSVHLPPGRWASWWDGTRVNGPATISVKAPIGHPPFYVRVGSVLPMFPSGVDTLVSSSSPGIVSIDAMAGNDAGSGWVSGPASAAWPDGSTLALADGSSAVTVTWDPQGTGRVLTLALDLSDRLSGASLSKVTASSGGAFTEEASDAAVRSAKGSAYHVNGASLLVRIEGKSEFEIR